MTRAEIKREHGGLSRLEVHWLNFLLRFVLVGSAWFAITGLLTFEPYTIRGYRAIPNEGCASSTFDLYLMRDANYPSLGWIGRVDLNIKWQNIATGETLIAASPQDVFNGTYGPGEDTLGIIAIAPDEPGDWRILTDAQVKGVKLLMPNEQNIAHQTDQVYTVLPYDHPDCVAKANGK